MLRYKNNVLFYKLLFDSEDFYYFNYFYVVLMASP